MKKNNPDDYVSHTKYLSGLNHMEYENNVFAIAFSTFLIKKRISWIINFKLFPYTCPYA